MPNHIHILISIPPKHSVSEAMGYIKGKSAIYIARRFGKREKEFLRVPNIKIENWTRQ